MSTHPTLRRRELLAAGAALGAGLTGCTRHEAARKWSGGWVGAAHERGHRLQAPSADALPSPATQRRVSVLIVGAGIAGLAAARSLRSQRIDDVHLIDLEDTSGGNSRAHRIAGIGCPLGAHYLPLPGDDAPEVAELLDELGLRSVAHGRAVYDERHLCHSPQERLYIDGQWQEGLLPRDDDDAALRAQYRLFGAAIDATRRALPFAMPTQRATWNAGHAALDAVTFASWLDAQRITHPKLRWYLDYCCRDDYGAGAAQVSAWAGVHYFASRHGFHAGGDEHDESSGVLTWPEGNAWLAERLAAPQRERLHTARIALRVTEGRHDVSVDVWDARAMHVERWIASQVVLAVPLFIARRLLDAPTAALMQAAAQMRYAPWLVSNLHIETPLTDRAGAAPAWDNVLYGSAALGYVDAMHQSLRPHTGPTVLTHYWALGGESAAQGAAQRKALLDAPWQSWAARVVDDVARAHPDLPRKLARIELMRYGHAMSIPACGVRGHAALHALAQTRARVRYANSDLAGYSVFEEAFCHGHAAGRGVAAVLRRS